MNGPTNEVWLDPWITYLRQRGVALRSGVSVKKIHATAAGVTSITAEQAGETQTITADYYIAAMPVEIMSALVTDDLKQIAPSMANLGKLRIAWMNGIQFYLSQDVPMEFGHTLYADSPWALTSISQRQFWTEANLANYGDGHVGGILSVDISDWEEPGILTGKPAMQSTAEEIQ